MIRVAVVDDEPLARRGVIARLSACEELVLAGEYIDGPSALNGLSAQAVDLAFIDIQMPGMDGFEATRRIRAWERAQHRRSAVPIVALTANALPDDAAACLACGMNDYLTKPIRSDQLLRMLRTAPALAPDAEPGRARVAAPGQALPATVVA